MRVSNRLKEFVRSGKCNMIMKRGRKTREKNKQKVKIGRREIKGEEKRKGALKEKRE